jgi:NAD(P)-dependent dehydrogenase (short-subunit alcohol dehydrogenase family)
MSIKKRMDLTGKNSIITGAAQGLGLAIAKALAKYGSNIVIVDVNDQDSDKLVHYFQNQYQVEAHFVKIDITKEDQVKQMVENVSKRFWKIDVLINNAGIANVENAEVMSYESWKRVIDVNLNGVFLMAREVGKQMIKQQRGSIINISSMCRTVVVTPQNQCSYNAS